MNNEDRASELVKLWLQREKRTRFEVLVFYAEIKKDRPDLLPEGVNGDPYQWLMAILQDHITDG